MELKTKEYKYIILNKENGYARIILNDPAKHNALNREMQLEIKDALSDIEKDDDIKLFIITGAGDKSFCVGADINVFKGIDVEACYRLMKDIGYEVHRMIEKMEKPSIAVVNGYCMAGGLEIALACDFIIASKNAVFSAPEIKLGIIPGWGGTIRLPRAIPIRKAKELIFTGGQLNATEAERIGLVNYVVEAAELEKFAKDIIDRIVDKPAFALKIAKMTITYGLETSDIDSGLAIERGGISLLAGTANCREGVNAFLEKRDAKFK